MKRKRQTRFISLTTYLSISFFVLLQEIAKEWWDKHLLRNNSKIVNIFHGQVRVQITCSEGHVVCTMKN